jgi:glutathione S-transferase
MLTLYYSPGACSLAPHVLLEELELQFERRPVRIAEGEHRSEDYLQINRDGRVPTLIVDGTAITEVPAILTYLAWLKPGAPMLPPVGTIELGKACELMAWLSSTLHIAYAHLWRPERFLPKTAQSKALVDHSRTRIREHCAEVERGIAGPWVLGKDYSAADAYLLPFYRWGNRIGIAMAHDFPRWTEWTVQMLGRQAVSRAIATEGIGDFV